MESGMRKQPHEKEQKAMETPTNLERETDIIPRPLYPHSQFKWDVSLEPNNNAPIYFVPREIMARVYSVALRYGSKRDFQIPMREIAKLIIMNKSDRDYVEKLSVIPKSKLGPMYFARYLLLTLYEILERKCNDKSLPEVPYTMITEGKRQRTRYYVGLKKEWLQIWDKCGLLSHVKEIVNKEPHLLQESKDEAPHGWEEQEDITESERESAPEDHSSPSSKKPKSELAPSIHGLEALHKLKNISETMVFLSQIQLQTVSAFIDDYTDLKEEVELLRKENQRLKNNSNG